MVFDRTRENLRKNLHLPVAEVFNRSLNEVLPRTIITSVTTFLAAFSLYLFADLPQRDTGCWSEKGLDGTCRTLDKSLYPEVTWDSEPLAMELSVKSDR